MHNISFWQKLVPPTHDGVPVWHREALVPVPVPDHPKTEHFVVCGLDRKMETPFSGEEMDRLQQAASRISIKGTKDKTDNSGKLHVVIDGRYTAGNFDLKTDYIEAVKGVLQRGEILAAECAVRSAHSLAQGKNPADIVTASPI